MQGISTDHCINALLSNKLLAIVAASDQSSQDLKLSIYSLDSTTNSTSILTKLEELDIQYPKLPHTSHKTHLSYGSIDDPSILLQLCGNGDLLVVDFSTAKYDKVNHFIFKEYLGFAPISLKSALHGNVIVGLTEQSPGKDTSIFYWRNSQEKPKPSICVSPTSFGSKCISFSNLDTSATHVEICAAGDSAVIVCPGTSSEDDKPSATVIAFSLDSHFDKFATLTIPFNPTSFTKLKGKDVFAASFESQVIFYALHDRIWYHLLSKPSPSPLSKLVPLSHSAQANYPGLAALSSTGKEIYYLI